MGPVKKADVKQAAAKLNIPLCCRACLATDGKLVNMQQHKLVGEFFRVSGIAFTKKDMYPQYLCVWCAALMKRCAAFRAKCLRANCCLQELKGNLTLDHLLTIDRHANKLVDLTWTETEIDSIDGVTMPADIHDELDTTNTKVPYVKKELFMEIDSLNEKEIIINVLKEENAIDSTINDTDDAFDIEYLDMSDEDVYDISNAESALSSEPTKNNPKKDVTNVNMSDTTKISTETSNNETKVKRRRRTRYEIENSGEEKRVKKIYRSAENNFMPTVNLEEFKENYGVDIHVLNYYEQMADIEARRDTDEYKRAPFTCEPCGKYFREEGAYSHHKAKHDEKRGPWGCPTCEMRFKWHSVRLTHYDNAHRFKFVCRRCGFVSRSRNQAKLHHSWHNGKRFQCPYCEKEFDKMSTYLGHVRLRHKTLNVVCGMCGETFVNEKGLKAHKASRHGVAKKKEHMECKTCSVTFISLDALEKHKMAAGEHSKMSACAQCGANFNSEDALMDHMEYEHPSCKECNATFLNEGSYHTHIRRKHLGRGDPAADKHSAANRRARALGVPLPYPPSKPTKNYTKSNAYRRQLCCEHCGKIFYNATMLSYHLQKLRGEKLRHACPHCPKSFHMKNFLEGHMRIHTGEKPFQCAQCGLTFSLKSNLGRHVRVIHLKQNPGYPCPICEKLFTTKSSAQLHVNSVHRGLPGPKRDRSKRKQPHNINPKKWGSNTSNTTFAGETSEC